MIPKLNIDHQLYMAAPEGLLVLLLSWTSKNKKSIKYIGGNNRLGHVYIFGLFFSLKFVLQWKKGCATYA